MTAARWAALVAVLSGCRLAAARGGSEPTVIEFWGLGRAGEVVQALMPEFERQHPGVHVRVRHYIEGIMARSAKG